MPDGTSQARDHQFATDSVHVDSTNSRPRAGDTFNAWRGVCGFYPPDVVGMQRFLTDGPKRVYERLVRFAGRDGHCFPSQETLARALGKSERQIRSDLKKLEEVRLISRRKRDGRRSNTYVFLWHGMFEEHLETRHLAPAEEYLNGCTLPVNGEPSEFERQDRVPLSGSRLPGNSVQEFRNKKTSPSAGGGQFDRLEQSDEPQPRTDAARNAPRNREPRAPAATVEVERWFEEEFWPNYWRKVDKAEGKKAFKKHATSEAKKDRIVAAVTAHAPYYLRRDPEHRPHASTWLNRRRYEEAPEDARPAALKPGLSTPTSAELPSAEDYLRRIANE